jgi:hypothetical protein
MRAYYSIVVFLFLSVGHAFVIPNSRSGQVGGPAESREETNDIIVDVKLKERAA